jgi:hypothetical protein
MTSPTSIPARPDTMLTRVQVSAALTEAGFPVSPTTLSTKATRGGGPPYQKFGTRALYRWESALQWANDLLTDPARRSPRNEKRRKALGELAETDAEII